MASSFFRVALRSGNISLYGLTREKLNGIGTPISNGALQNLPASSDTLTAIRI